MNRPARGGRPTQRGPPPPQTRTPADDQSDHHNIEDGDRVMVGLSGGKDSWALMQMLDNLRQRAPITFSLIAVNVDSGYKDFKHDVIAKTCEERGWEYRIEHTSIGDVMDDILEPNATPVLAVRAAAPRRAVPDRRPKSAPPRSRSAITSTTSSRRCS